MKVVLYMAVSADGYIAKSNGDSEWVSEKDSNLFEQQIHKSGGLIVGKNTFNQYQTELYPIEKVLNIVMSSKEPKNEELPENIKFANSPNEAIKIAESASLNQIMLIGGGVTNGHFLKDELINEMYLSVYPLILGKGIKLFEGIESHQELKLLDQKPIENGIIQFHYQVI